MPVREELERLFRDVFGNESIVLTDETTAQDIPEWDSLGHVNLMFSIEERFGVRFHGNELAEFENVGELARFLEAHENGRGHGR
jgi:acyl carrier protein